MSILHTISKSPRQQSLDNVLKACGDGDGILFIEDGVYHCADKQSLASKITDLRCYSLKEDLNARGISILSSQNIENISYRGFVDLCTKYEKVISWF